MELCIVCLLMGFCGDMYFVACIGECLKVFVLNNAVFCLNSFDGLCFFYDWWSWVFKQHHVLSPPVTVVWISLPVMYVGYLRLSVFPGLSGHIVHHGISTGYHLDQGLICIGHLQPWWCISVAKNLEILEKLTSLGGSIFLFWYIERKKYFRATFMCPKWKMDPPKEVNFSKISKFWATLVVHIVPQWCTMLYFTKTKRQDWHFLRYWRTRRVFAFILQME